MNARTGLLSNTRRTAREWAAIVAGAVLIHIALLLFFKPQYLAFLRREAPPAEEGWSRYPYLDNPFQVSPLAPALPVSPVQPSLPDPSRDERDAPLSEIAVGEPQIEMPLLRPSSRASGAGKSAGRSATVQPKPLYIPWPTYPKGVKETEGSVELLVLVNERGEVEDVTVARSLPAQELNRIALDAARRIRFIPGMERGVRTSMWVRLTIAFQPR